MSNGENNQAKPVAAALPASNLTEAELTDIVRAGPDAIRAYLQRDRSATPALPAEKVQGLTEARILELSDLNCVTFKNFNGGRESPYVDGHDTTEDVIAFARDLLAASGGVPAPALPVVPEGHKIVPIEPTEAMMHAAEDVPAPRPYGAVYRAMLAAAPELPEGNQQPQTDSEVIALHGQLAHEKLRADQGWERYEAANRSHQAALGALEMANVRLAELTAAPSHAASTEPVSNFTATQAAQLTDNIEQMLDNDEIDAAILANQSQKG